MKCAVAYRVSTKQQHRSGLGIEVQRAAVARFAGAEQIRLITEYVEAETGKGADALDRRTPTGRRPGRRTSRQMPVIVSKLDRLSRDVAYLWARGATLCRSSWPSSAQTPIRSCCISTPLWRRRSATRFRAHQFVWPQAPESFLPIAAL